MWYNIVEHWASQDEQDEKSNLSLELLHKNLSSVKKWWMFFTLLQVPKIPGCLYLVCIKFDTSCTKIQKYLMYIYMGSDLTGILKGHLTHKIFLKLQWQQPSIYKRACLHGLLVRPHPSALHAIYELCKHTLLQGWESIVFCSSKIIYNKDKNEFV